MPGINFKKTLKTLQPLYLINACWKARRTKNSYTKLNNYYNSIAIKEKIIPQNRCISPIDKKDLRIIFVGTDKEQDYCGIIQGLEKFGNVIPFEQETGAYGQIVLDQKNVNTAILNGKSLISIVKNALKTGPIHVIIGQMWCWSMDTQSLRIIRNMGIPIVNISMDDRHAFRIKKNNGRWMGTAGLIGAIDLACTAAKECCLWYQLEGCPAIYLPEASDPELFKPYNYPKEYDVCFVGANYGIRSEIVKSMEKRGIKVQSYGNGWPNGRIDIKQLPIIFSKSQIILGVGTIGHCKDFYSLKMRDFDGPMSGSFYLTHDNRDLYDLYEVGKEIETYRNPEECYKKIKYYLSEPLKAESIAKAGRARAIKEHTWEKRFQKVLGVIGLIKQ